jgi:hypothetical protein
VNPKISSEWDMDHWVCGFKSIKGPNIIALLLEGCSALVQVSNPGLTVLYGKGNSIGSESLEIQYLRHKFRCVAS